MKSVPIKQAIGLVKRQLKAMHPERLILLTHKKDRSITLVIHNQTAILTEQGYQNTTSTYPLKDGSAKHAVQVAFKREFPRSHQVYVGENSK